MINLIKADLYRSLRNPALYIALILVIFVHFFSVLQGHVRSYIGSPVMKYSQSEGIEYPTRLGWSKHALETLSEEKRMNTSDEIVMWAASLEEKQSSLPRDMIANNANLYYSLLLIVFVFLVSDLSASTVKNTISSSASRRNYVIAKYGSVLLSTALLVFVSDLFAYYMTKLFQPSAYTEPIGDHLRSSLYQMPYLLGMAAMMTALGFLLKKTYVFFPIGVIAMIILQMLSEAAFNVYHLEFVRIFLWKYEFQMALVWLANFPQKSYILQCCLIGFFEIIISITVSCMVFRKTEIK